MVVKNKAQDPFRSHFVTNKRLAKSVICPRVFEQLGAPEYNSTELFVLKSRATIFFAYKILQKSQKNHKQINVFIDSGLGAHFQRLKHCHKHQNLIPDRFGYRPTLLHFFQHLKTSNFTLFGISECRT